MPLSILFLLILRDFINATCIFMICISISAGLGDFRTDFITILLQTDIFQILGYFLNMLSVSDSLIVTFHTIRNTDHFRDVIFIIPIFHSITFCGFETNTIGVSSLHFDSLIFILVIIFYFLYFCMFNIILIVKVIIIVILRFPLPVLVPAADGGDGSLSPLHGVGECVGPPALVLLVHRAELQLELLEADLAVDDGQGVHPHPPAPVLELDGVVQQHPEQREHHVADLALLLGGRVDHSQGDQPFLKQQIYRISRFCGW